MSKILFGIVLCTLFVTSWGGVLCFTSLLHDKVWAFETFYCIETSKEIDNILFHILLWCQWMVDVTFNNLVSPQKIEGKSLILVIFLWRMIDSKFMYFFWVGFLVKLQWRKIFFSLSLIVLNYYLSVRYKSNQQTARQPARVGSGSPRPCEMSDFSLRTPALKYCSALEMMLTLAVSSVRVSSSLAALTHLVLLSSVMFGW